MTDAGRLRSISYQEFVQRVRRHRGSHVLRVVARENSSLAKAKLFDQPLPRTSPVVPFALGGIARIAIRHGTEHRDLELSHQRLRQLCLHYINMRDPLVESMTEIDSLRPLLSRIAYEQFDTQYSVDPDLGRTVSLLLDHMQLIEGAPSAEEWSELLGCGLEQFIRIGYALYIASVLSGGSFKASDLQREEVAKLFEPLGVDGALQIADSWFAGTVESLKERARDQEVIGAERWSFNPLIDRPVVKIDDDLVVPWPELCIRKVTPAGLYHVARERWGSGFTDRLGLGFEKYVGSQLRLLQSTTILPEIVFGSPEQKTVDYFVITDEVVLLVEVKSSRPVMSTRLGDQAGDQDVLRKVGHAMEQVRRTAELITGEHPALANIPRDRPLRGVVVTLEPFHLINTPFYDDVLRSTGIPTSVISSSELEEMTGMMEPATDQGGRLLTAFTPEHSNVPLLSEAVEGLEMRLNPIVGDAWDRFFRPWRDLGAESK